KPRGSYRSQPGYRRRETAGPRRSPMQPVHKGTVGREGKPTLTAVLAAVCAGAACLASSAGGSQLVDRNATDVTLLVNGKGEALLTYVVAGRTRHVLAWGAVNAIAPTQSRPQVAFELDYAG